jgi:hypothetical protein
MVTRKDNDMTIYAALKTRLNREPRTQGRNRPHQGKRADRYSDKGQACLATSALALRFAAHALPEKQGMIGKPPKGLWLYA